MITFGAFLKESETLKRFTQTDDFRYLKGAVASEYEYLRKKYPFDGGVLYRGLNFSSPSQYLKFRRSIRDGYIKSETISSWSPSQNTAFSFAISPQVFIPTAAVLSGYDPNERVNGFIGIIVKIKVRSIGIDVRKSKVGSEDEVILPAGSYKIEDMIIEKKWKHIVHRLDINQEVSDIIDKKKNVMDNDLMRQLFRYKGQEIDPNLKTKIVKHAVDTFIKTQKVNISQENKHFYFSGNEKERQLLFPDGVYKFNIYGSLGMLDFFILDDAASYITAEDKSRLRKYVIDKINSETKVLNNKKALVQYNNGFNYLSKMFDIKLSELKYLAANYADVYNRFNLLLRDWNKQRHFSVREMTDLLKQSMESPFK